MPDDGEIPIEEGEQETSAGWVIVVVHGMRFIGQLRRGVLEPCYELQVSMGPDGRGNMAISHTALPVGLLPSWKSVALPDGALLQSVDELSRQDRDVLFRAILSGEQIAASIRSSQSGIVAARAVPGLRRR